MNGIIKTLLASALTVIAGNVMGQTLRVTPIKTAAGEQTILTVSLTGATAMTALQFNLELPEGMMVDDEYVTTGAATNGHELKMETLANGNHLFVLYSMDLNTFSDGELLRIPMNVSSVGADASVRIHTVRLADTEAVSHVGEVASATLTAIKDVVTEHSEKSEGSVYDLNGRRLTQTRKGVYIVGGSKVVK